jgi:hypothetical protein
MIRSTPSAQGTRTATPSACSPKNRPMQRLRPPAPLPVVSATSVRRSSRCPLRCQIEVSGYYPLAGRQRRLPPALLDRDIGAAGRRRHAGRRPAHRHARRHRAAQPSEGEASAATASATPEIKPIHGSNRRWPVLGGLIHEYETAAQNRRPQARPDSGTQVGERGSSSRAIRADLRKGPIKATIPEPSDQQQNGCGRGRRDGRPPVFDPDIYHQRNVVERAINSRRRTPRCGHSL